MDKKYMVNPITNKKIIDYRGRRIGKIIVIDFDTEKTKEEYFKKGGHNATKYWICKCDCGNIKSIAETTLSKNKDNTTCGCGVINATKNRHSKFRDNNIGKKFGRLTILKCDNNNSESNRTRYICQCECGNVKSVSWDNLKNGHIKSCGCYNSELVIERVRIDLTNKKFGKLTVIKRDTKDTSKWICKCECGNITKVSTSSLSTGHTTSCGCINSKGEFKIRKALDELNLKYEQQMKFDNLKGVGGNPLSYDFYLEDFNILIEYQGEFHDGTARQQTEEQFKIQKEHDKRKKEYAISHNINLLEIWYYDYDNIENILKEVLKR